MSDKVVSLRTGTAILAPGEVSEATVALLESLMVMAQCGELQGLVAFTAYSDGAIGCEQSAGLPITYRLIGRMLQETNDRAANASNSG